MKSFYHPCKTPSRSGLPFALRSSQSSQAHLTTTSKKGARFIVLAFFLSLLSLSSYAQNKDWLVKMQDPNVNFWEVQADFNTYWQGRTDYKGNGYKVFKRWEYINEARALPDGRLQGPDVVLREYERYMAEAPAEKSSSGTWTIVGPTSYPTNNTGQPTGKGRINAIAFHPTDANTMYIGAPSGGIWKTTTGGTSWTNLSMNIPYLGVSAILIHPTDPNIIFIGTGDRDGGEAPGIGVYKSTDGGSTWAPMNFGMGNTTVGMMLMDPNDPNTLIAATRTGIFKSTDGAVTWTSTLSGDFRDIKFKPNDASIVYATKMITPSEFYRSTDGGNTWSLIATPTAGVGSRMVIGVSPANANYVYLVQIKEADENFQAFLRSTDSGQTFVEQSNSPNIFDYACNGLGTASQALYDLCIEVDDSNADIVYVGSINSWKSTNGGVSWSPVSHWVGSNFAPGDPTANCAVSVHADHHVYAWSPLHTPKRLYLGHDGGLAYTDNGGTTWIDVSSDLAIGQIYKIGQSAQSVGTVMAGFQDNGVSVTANGISFTTVAGGDGAECAIDYNNPNFCYRETQNGALRRSTTGVFGAGSNIISGLTDQAAFIAPYMLHKTIPSTMFFPRENVWRSTNVTALPASSVNWQAISTFPGGTSIQLIEQSKANLDILYISRGGGSSSLLYRSDNANAAAASVTWTSIPKPQGLTVTDIEAHPTDENIVYVTAGTKVFKSTNKGLDWTDISANLPALFVNCLVLDKDANEGIYIGNQTGVWYKDATISDWVLFSAGLPPVDVRELEIYYDVNPDNSRITAATYGRGIWQSDLIEINVVNPSNLAAYSKSTSQIDLQWTLNAAGNNVLLATSPTTNFGVPVEGTSYVPGNALPGGGTVIYVGNLTNFNHTGLTANTNYCYKIWSVNNTNQYSAGLPPVCASTLSHDWTGNVNTDWFNPGNWGPGTVPTAQNGANIPAGRPNYPLINAAGATCKQLSIQSGASVSMDATAAYTLQVTGDWVNDGTFNRGIGTVDFNGNNELQKIIGSSTTDFYILKVTKQSSNNILDALSPITLNALVDAPLNLVSGTFRLSNAASNITAIRANGTVAANAIGLNKRVWVHAGTLNVTSSWRLNQGELKITGGVVNIGNANNQFLDYINSGKIDLEGGALNVAAGIWGNATNKTSTGVMEISGGVMTTGIFSNGFSRGMLEVNANCTFSMSDGTIVIRSNNGHTEHYYNLSANASVTGGTLQIGDASTPAGQTIRLNSTVPVYNLTVNATNAPVARLVTNNLTVKNNVTISGGTLDANNLNINVGGNWTNNGIFQTGTGTVTFNGSVNQTLGGSNGTTFNNLVLNNAAGFTMSGTVNTFVNGVLTFTNGVLSTGNNVVIITPTGSVVRTLGHVFGKLEKNVSVGSNISRTFEIGDATVANYTPVALTLASVTTAGDLIARVTTGDHPSINSAIDLNPAKSVNRYWALINSGVDFSTYDATFNFLTSDLDPAVNTSALLCGKFNSPNWTYPAMGTRTATSSEITGVASFSDFQLAEPSCVNPDVPTLAATPNPVCAGQSTTLSIATGNLNGAANWQWYSGSCGGTPVGTGTSIMVSPSSNTTYYARGEGGCVVTPASCGSIAIVAPPAIVLTETHVNVLCNGGNTGSIDLTVSGGVGPYTYLWTGGVMTEDRSNLSAGTYTVTVTDLNSCTKTLSATITETSAVVLTETHVNVLCNGGNTGSIDLTVSGGVGPYTYLWTGGVMTEDRSNLSAGTYTVTVTDLNSCTKTLSATITETSTVVLTETHVNVLCNGGNTGSIDLTVSGGTGPYTYLWTGGVMTEDRSNLSAGTYTVTVTDVSSCTKTLSATITETSAVVLTETHVNVLCNGGNTGSIDLTVSGGVGPYTYLWTGGVMTEDRSNLSAGTYTVTVTDLNSCTKTLSATITETSTVVLTETHVNVLCNGGNTGSIDLTVSGGVGPYTYLWTGGVMTEDRSNLSAGTYTVTVTDLNSCTKTLSATITETSAVVLTETHVNVLCNGGNTGSIDLTVSGGVGPYTYLWTGGVVTEDRSNLPAGTYTVTVTDLNSCTKTLSATITETSAVVLTETHVDVVCNNLGSIDLTVAGGVSPYTYLWTGGVVTEDRTGLAAGTYTVTVTDLNSCTKTLSVTITETVSLVLTETHVNVLCNGGSTGSIDLTVTGGMGPYTYFWTGGVITEDRTGLVADTYTVTVTDFNSCTKTLSATITEAAGMVLTETHVNVLCNGNSTGSIDLTVSGGTPGYSYNWGGGITTQDRTGLVAGTYTVTVTDANGCTKSTAATITQPAPLSVVSSIVNPSNCFVANGSIDITVSGGISGYTYDWSNDGPETPDNDLQDLLNVVEGTYTVTVTDGNGCTITHTRTLDYIDVVPPSITCPANQNVSASFACTGNVGVWAPVSLSDNCTPSASITVTQTPPANTVLSGHNDSELVTLTANDGNGNFSSCSFTVTLKDVTLPTALCKNVTANLGANGTVTVAPALVNNGSSDNCTFTLTLTPNTFNCFNIGMTNTVVLRATDAAGNSATCSAKVTVKDASGPVAKCKNPVLFLDNLGQATLSVAQVNNGSTDNCGINTMTISETHFNCSNLPGSAWPVTLNLTDVNGNTSSCISYVTVKEAIVPTAMCEDVTVQLNASGNAAVYGADLASGSTDNCSVWSYSPIAKVYKTTNIGDNNLTITVKDWSGNAATCVSVVTVLPFNGPSPNPSDDTEIFDVAEYAFNVYPNPTTGDVSVAFELPAEQAVSIQVYDMQGRMILSREDIGFEGVNTLALRLEGIPSGLYLVDFQSADLKAKRRLMVR